MGVTGLWRLIEPTGKPVPVETLENKVLAVDISIWLHQMVKGYQDAKGAPLPNAHLMGLFQRLCKLLYFRIKPVFVFDGAFPDLKRETIAKRQDNKAKYNSESERIRRELALLLSKKTAIGNLLGKQISPKKGNSLDVNNDDDIFKLPALPQKDETESESEDEHDSSGSIVDLHSIDIESDKFKNMPTREKYELLIELKETRKMNSWGKLHELPKKSDTFSNFQMDRLLKRRKIQECMQDVEKEIGDSGMSLNELESLLNEEGIDTKIEALPTRRIASDNTTRFLLINNVNQALSDAKVRNDRESKIEELGDKEKPKTTEIHSSNKKDELEEDLQKAIKMSLECTNEFDTSACTSKADESWNSITTSSLTDYSDTDDDTFIPPDISSAKAYIMQYTDLTHIAIDEIMDSKNQNKHKVQNESKITEILDDLNQNKSVITDNIEISSDEACDNGDENVNNHNKKKAIEDTEKDINESNKSMDMSVMFVENSEQNITLDTNTEESIVNKNTKSCTTNSYTEFQNYDEFNEDLQKAIKMSLECMDETERKIIKKDSESDSLESDDDFEEVLDTGNLTSNKPIVHLTLNMGSAPEDDIFADVFTNNKKYQCNDQNVDSVKSYIEQDLIENEIGEKSNQDHKSERELNVSSKHGTESLQQNLTVTQVTTTSPVVIDTQTNDKSDNEETRQLSKETLFSTLNTITEEIHTEEQHLLQEKGRLDRIGRNITEQMTKEVQELLQIFGIPYVVAPMEAEAQCAFLESVNLTDGTITDDSDIWLFGGKTVYKNFFNQKKHVLQFVAERIEKSFNLTREQLILLALLVGSDYTTGVTGVGPVTAMEILASFPFSRKQFMNETSKQGRYIKIVEGLQEFKQWVKTGRRTDNTTLRKKLRNISLTDDFPSIRVVQSYLEPNVERSEEKFTWGKIDITILRDYTKTKFGWSQNKLDEIIKPVLKRISDSKTQKTVHDYFKVKHKIEFQSVENQLSERVKAAVQRMDPNVSTEEITSQAKKKLNKNKAKDLEENKRSKAGPSKAKQRKIHNETDNCSDHAVKVVIQDSKSDVEINIPKSDRFQEIIPQREKDRQNLLQNKLKAIEVFRKTTIDKKTKRKKKRANIPKEKADLSESSDSN